MARRWYVRYNLPKMISSVIKSLNNKFSYLVLLMWIFTYQIKQNLDGLASSCTESHVIILDACCMKCCYIAGNIEQRIGTRTQTKLTIDWCKIRPNELKPTDRLGAPFSTVSQYKVRIWHWTKPSTSRLLQILCIQTCIIKPHADEFRNCNEWWIVKQNLPWTQKNAYQFNISKKGDIPWKPSWF